MRNKLIEENEMHQPSLAIYLRNSKKGSEIEQIRKLQSAVNYFTQSDEYWLNGSWYFMDNLTLESDLGKAGDTINSGLRKYLDQLTAYDVCLVQNVKRLSRMDIRDDEFNYLVDKLFSNEREVWHLSESTNKQVDEPSLVTKAQFIEYAKLSNEEYNKLRELSALGNEMQSNAKEILLTKALSLFDAGFTNRVVAMELGKSMSMIPKYKRELRSRGHAIM